MIPSNSLALLFFQNGGAGVPLSKILPWPGCVLPLRAPPHTSLPLAFWECPGLHPAAGPAPRDSLFPSRRVTELQGSRQPGPHGKRPGPQGFTKSKLVFLVHSPATSLPGQSRLKHKGLGRNPKVWTISDWSVTSRELAEKSFLSTGRKRIEIKLFSK